MPMNMHNKGVVAMSAPDSAPQHISEHNLPQMEQSSPQHREHSLPQSPEPLLPARAQIDVTIRHRIKGQQTATTIQVAAFLA